MKSIRYVAPAFTVLTVGCLGLILWLFSLGTPDAISGAFISIPALLICFGVLIQMWSEWFKYRLEQQESSKQGN